MQYRTILADPPWTYKNSDLGPKSRNSAQKHYRTLTVEEIKKLDIQGLVDRYGCFCFLWVTSSHLPDGLEVLGAWGFKYRQILTWIKPGIGMGYYFRMASEHILVGTIGHPAVHVHNLPSWFMAKRSKHSRKPTMFYGMIEKISDSPRLELFAREKRQGWDSWGDEVKSDISLSLCG